MSPEPARNPFTTRELPETSAAPAADDPSMDMPEAWLHTPHDDVPMAEEAVLDYQMPCPCGQLDALGETVDERRQGCYLCDGSGVTTKALLLRLYLDFAGHELNARAWASSDPTIARAHPAMDLQTALTPPPHMAINDSLAHLGQRVIVQIEDTATDRWCIAVKAAAPNAEPIRLIGDLAWPRLIGYFTHASDQRLDLLAWRPFVTP